MIRDFCRAMRAKGFRYHRLSRGAARFTRERQIGGQTAIAQAIINLDALAATSVSAEQLVQTWLAATDAQFRHLERRIPAA
jgi:hypothetical protein